MPATGTGTHKRKRQGRTSECRKAPGKRMKHPCMGILTRCWRLVWNPKFVSGAHYNFGISLFCRFSLLCQGQKTSYRFSYSLTRDTFWYLKRVLIQFLNRLVLRVAQLGSPGSQLPAPSPQLPAQKSEI